MWHEANLSPEVLLMRMCVRFVLGHMDMNECRPYLKASLDIAVLLHLLHEERMLLLVYQVLSGELKADVPEKILARISQEAHRILPRQLALMASLEQIKIAFEKAGIPYLALKGPDLNQALWGRRMMRYSGDLDILISPKDIFRANKSLNALNFNMRCSKRKLWFYQKLHQFVTEKDIIYLSRDSNVCLELHWKTHHLELIFTENQVKSHAVESELYVLYLCLHAAKHAWSRLIWLIDILAFLQVKNIDINQVRELAAERHVLSVVDEFILLAKNILKVEITPNVCMDKRANLLQKRIKWKQVSGSGNSMLTKLISLLFENAFCSSKPLQLRLWLKVLIRVAMLKMHKTLKLNQA